ncbi:hypothetical protein RRG08_012294 [Elysia crispata]|uniref:Uncharacterized protein n=1 Tax=Elysia crispata TaxID=231223 RepID=A0AAE1BBH5_9GAST|nr:hypothetical protein RRG08_012294 [Elysia crispata]
MGVCLPLPVKKGQVYFLRDANIEDFIWSKVERPASNPITRHYANTLPDALPHCLSQMLIETRGQRKHPGRYLDVSSTRLQLWGRQETVPVNAEDKNCFISLFISTCTQLGLSEVETVPGLKTSSTHASSVFIRIPLESCQSKTKCCVLFPIRRSHATV